MCVAYEKNRDHGKCILVTMNIQITRFSQMRSNSADSTHTLHPIPPPFGKKKTGKLIILFSGWKSNFVQPPKVTPQAFKILVGYQLHY